MRRRTLVLSVAAAALAGTAALAALAVWAVTNTEVGLERVRRLVVAQAAGAVHGRLHVGRLSGNLLGDLRVDSLEIRGLDDSLFVATGPLRVTYDLRDLIDRRILLRSVQVLRPVVRLHEYGRGRWNWKDIFPPSRAPVPVSPTRGFGDWVALGRVTVRDLRLLLIQPWEPPAGPTAAVRDSLLRVGQREHELRRGGPTGWEKLSRYSQIDAVLASARLAHPDSAAQVFVITRASGALDEPAFWVRHASGVVRKHDDTVWVDIPDLRLAASRGAAKGVVWWGGDLPQQWDVRIRGDSACMTDYGWIYPTLPRTGCGRTDLWIHSDPRRPAVMDYQLTNLDLTSTRSRLRGRMTFGVGAPLLEVRDLDLTASPVDMDLLRVFKGGDFPYDWQGTLEGRVRGPGGPVNRFVLEDARLTYRDRHVPGAVSAFRGRGMLDITEPADAVFRGFDVTTDVVDLRTIRYVNPGFPELNGIVRGRLRLDSLWYDVRFRDAALEHVDGPGQTTRLTGRGRITVADAFTRLDLTMAALPMSFGMLRRSYPSIPLRVPMAGTFSVRGTSDSLETVAAFAGPDGAFSFTGVGDVYGDTLDPRRGFTGAWTFDSLDVRAVLADTSLPATRLTGRVDGALHGDTLLPTLEGAVTVEVGRGMVGPLRLFGARGRLAFADSGLRADSLRVETTAATVTAQGGLGLGPTRRDSLRVVLQADSLGGLRPWLGSAAGSDSLAGSVVAEALLAGNPDSLDLRAQGQGLGLVRNGVQARRLAFTAALRHVTATPAIEGTATLDTVSAGPLRFLQATASARTAEGGALEVALAAEGRTGPALRADGSVARAADTTRVRLDRLALVLADEAWSLARPAQVVQAGDRLVLDSAELAGPEGARLSAAGAFAPQGPIALRARVEQVPIATLARLAGADGSFRGRLDAEWRAEGTRDTPRMTWRATLGDVAGAGRRRVRLDAAGAYRDGRADAEIALRDSVGTLLRGTLLLPVDLALAPREDRFPDGGRLDGRLQADAVDLGVLEGFTTVLRNASGRLDVGLDLGGTWSAPRLVGAASVRDAAAEIPALGRVALRDVQAGLRFLGDTAVLERLTATSVARPTGAGRRELGTVRTGRLDAVGRLAFADLADPLVDLALTLDRFNAVAKPRLADLDVTGRLALAGRPSGATLEGALEVSRGTLVIPDVGQQKQLVDARDPDFLRVVDTALFSGERLLPSPPSRLVENLRLRDVRITMGPDVWLRSAEANINLGGAVSVARRRVARGADSSAAELSLDGTLLVNRGTYRLNIGDVVQRTFDVEQGRIAFSPIDPTFNPGLDISAIHTVRSFNSTIAQQDRRIRVRIGGTLQQPLLAFESADNARLSQSDLISYLITGAPAFGVGDPTQAGGALNTAANVLLTSLSSALADRIASLGYLDYVQIQTAGLDRGVQQAGAPSDPAQQILSSTRIGGGLQLSDRLFLSGDAGLCPFIQPQANASVWSQFGVRLEYRIATGVTLSGGVEPPQQMLLCTNASVRGFVLTPQQIGVDLTAAWRF